MAEQAHRRSIRGISDSVIANLLTPVIAVILGLAVSVPAFAAALLYNRFKWLGLPTFIAIGLGLSLVVLGVLLAVVPRWWRPKGPFGRRFGVAPYMVGVSEERDREVFRVSAPPLREECTRVAIKLLEFVVKEEKGLPKPPEGVQPNSPEQKQFNEETHAFLQKFSALYRGTWQHKVENLFVDARAMYFGPLPLTDDRFMHGSLIQPQVVHDYALALDALGRNVPERYTDDIHNARMERLRRLKHDGIRLAADIAAFLTERSEAQTKLHEQAAEAGASDPTSHADWQRDTDFMSETGTLFVTQFGGTALRVYRELRDFGLSDPLLDRTLANYWGPIAHGGHDVPAVAALISALCQQIRYD